VRSIAIAALMIVSAGAGALLHSQGGTRTTEPDRVVRWSDADLKALDLNELIPNAKASIPKGSSVGAKYFLNTAEHTVLISHRESVGNKPELHHAETDIMFVRSGGGILQIGGEIVDRKENAAGATGSSMRGATDYTVVPGDVINIPPNVAHNWILQPGQNVTYFVVKVKTATDATH
jgi:mannose-6-phosphate isomerase-like protein (cupin superfamily)